MDCSSNCREDFYSQKMDGKRSQHIRGLQNLIIEGAEPLSKQNKDENNRNHRGDELAVF